MNVQSNSYTFIYASVMVIVVAALLAFVALSLQPQQQKNIDTEKKQNILASVGIKSTPLDAEKLFNQYVKESFVMNASGEKNENKAFDVNLVTEVKLISEMRKAENELAKNQGDKNTLEKLLTELKTKRQLPVYHCIKNDTNFYVFPLRGKGLWGPIWGYIALYDDFNTIYGAVFDHKGETPGLGADIDKPWFQEPFRKKTIFDESGNFVSIRVYKGGNGAAKLAGDTKHGVDAISGGTITSKGLEAMLHDCLIDYLPYIKQQQTSDTTNVIK